MYARTCATCALTYMLGIIWDPRVLMGGIWDGREAEFDQWFDLYFTYEDPVLGLTLEVLHVILQSGAGAGGVRARERRVRDRWRGCVYVHARLWVCVCMGSCAPACVRACVRPCNYQPSKYQCLLHHFR